MHTYTPGYARAKEVVLIFGILITLLGFWQCYPALHALTSGHTAYATVISVVKVKPGYADEVYSTTQIIPDEENRSANFRYRIEYADAIGVLHTTFLNLVTNQKASFKVSESVRIAYLPGKPDYVFATFDFGTWVAGGLFCLFGLALSATFALLRYYANHPIALPPNTPVFPGSINS